MQTTLDCIPCFLRQALKAGRLACPNQEEVHKQIIYKFCELVPQLDLTLSPPALAGKIYGHISKITKQKDPFKKYKQDANKKALQMLPQLKQIIDQSPDKLKTALHISIIGNYIDAGIETNFNWENALFKEKNTLDEQSFQLFIQKLQTSSSIMILGDNTGEIALDTLLVQELKSKRKQVIYVVREKPIINDATLEDAREVGMTKLCEVISSGVSSPGTVLENCSQQFIQYFKKADIILSKGQGNFEALIDKKDGIFFAFKVKCPVVVKLTGKKLGESVFFYK